ncbi:hypothetical protein [Frateuria sp. STR12]|uniref:hypothetical protein n=1 Tax=Frateuria hangzhouensis TaxID=2995589 RepID=UPI002260F436|nr:hypothetical protein [Frateuria sp. STR12]MCX7512847.1 hypothetical protein [Frateuria sp. STR12]
MIKFLPRRALCAGLVVFGFSASALAAQPLSTGLGQAWPNAQDVSANPHWHVYVFANNGIRYVQVNDLNGNIRTAFGAANGQFLVLPMGRDAQRLSTPQQPLSTSDTVVPLTSYTETVYSDSSIKLEAVPMSDGTTMFQAAPTTSALAAPVSPCDNPVECNGHIN